MIEMLTLHVYNDVISATLPPLQLCQPTRRLGGTVSTVMHTVYPPPPRLDDTHAGCTQSNRLDDLLFFSSVELFTAALPLVCKL